MGGVSVKLNVHTLIYIHTHTHTHLRYENSFFIQRSRKLCKTSCVCTGAVSLKLECVTTDDTTKVCSIVSTRPGSKSECCIPTLLKVSVLPPATSLIKFMEATTSKMYIHS